MSEYSYNVVLEPAGEGGYTVTVPALPAVVTEGDSVDEAIEMAKDAIECYLSSLAKEGLPLPVEEGPGRRDDGASLLVSRCRKDLTGWEKIRQLPDSKAGLTFGVLRHAPPPSSNSRIRPRQTPDVIPPVPLC